MKYARFFFFLVFLFSALWVPISSESIPVERTRLEQIYRKIQVLEVNLETQQKRVAELLQELVMLRRESEASETDLQTLKEQLMEALELSRYYKEQARLLQEELTGLQGESGQLTMDLERYQQDCTDLEKTLSRCLKDINKIKNQRNWFVGISLVELGLIVLFAIF